MPADLSHAFAAGILSLGLLGLLVLVVIGPNVNPKTARWMDRGAALFFCSSLVLTVGGIGCMVHRAIGGYLTP